jgi:DNA-binding Xre family transcriptional regulator
VLEERHISLTKMTVDVGISTRTAAKFKKGESVTVDTLSKICKYLQVPVENVVEIDY